MTLACSFIIVQSVVLVKIAYFLFSCYTITHISMQHLEAQNLAQPKQENGISKLQIVNAVTSTLINNAGEKPEQKEEMAITFWTEIIDGLKKSGEMSEIEKLCASKNISVKSVFENTPLIWTTTKKFLINPTDRIEIIRELMNSLAKNPIHEIDSNGFIGMLKVSLNQAVDEQNFIMNKAKIEEVEPKKEDIKEGFVSMFEFLMESEEFKDALNDISFILRTVLIPEVNRSQMQYKSPLVQNVFTSIEQDIHDSSLRISEIGAIMIDTLESYSNTKISDFANKQEMKKIKTEIELLISSV
jgi:hypothetical protein